MLWAQIERLAAAELRSVNAQVEYLLREAVRARIGGQSPQVQPSDQDNTGNLAPPPSAKAS